MSLLSRLFGGRPKAEAEASSEDHKGFRITPKPIREGGQYRVAARVEKDGRVHELVRADTLGSAEEAALVSIAKAKQMIDEQGERIFG